MATPSDIGTSDIPSVIGVSEYFIMGKTRIKITEHFAPNGKQISEVITELITLKSKEKVVKTA